MPLVCVSSGHKTSLPLVKGNYPFPSLLTCRIQVFWGPGLWGRGISCERPAGALRPLAVNVSIFAGWSIGLQSGLMSTTPLLQVWSDRFSKSSRFSTNRCHKRKTPSKMPSNRVMKLETKWSLLFLVLCSRETGMRSQAMKRPFSNSLSHRVFAF